MAHILLIDDDPQIRKLLGEVLEQNGHTIIQCANGTDGTFQYIQSIFDLVILDVFLPDDGLETLRKLKQHHAQVNVMVISGGIASDYDPVLLAAQRLGVRNVLAKPFDLANFLSVVNQLLPSPKTSS